MSSQEGDRREGPIRGIHTATDMVAERGRSGAGTSTDSAVVSIKSEVSEFKQSVSEMVSKIEVKLSEAQERASSKLFHAITDPIAVVAPISRITSDAKILTARKASKTGKR